MIHAVFIQAGYYGVVVLLTMGILGFVQKGFFWNYIRVRLSFGRLILIKVRGITRDFFAVGHIEEGTIVTKFNKSQKRVFVQDQKKETAIKNKEGKIIKIRIENPGVFYRCLSVIWVDYDEQKHALSKTDYTGVEGYDAVKNEHLLKRALYSPPITDNKEKIMIVCTILITIGIIVAIFIGVKNGEAIKIVYNAVQNMPKVDTALVMGKGTP